jgi:hypothetical protein
LFDVFRRFLRAFLLSAIVGLFPLIFLWKNNLGQISSSAVLPSLLYTLLYVLIVFLVWLFFVRSLEKSVLLSVVTTVFVFSFGHLFTFVGDKEILGISIGFIKLFLVSFILFGVLCFLIIQRKHIPNLSLPFLPLVVLTLLNIAAIGLYSFNNRQPISQPVLPVETVQTENQDLPDIYFIVLDAYAREDILKEVIGYDNSDFLNSLRSRGFYIPECAFSNYDGTISAVTSVLNYELIDPVESSETFTNNRIENNQARSIFHSYGYQFVGGRGYLQLIDIGSADIYLNHTLEKNIKDSLDEERFASLYLNTTIFRVLSGLIENNPEKFSYLPFWLVVDPLSNTDLLEANFWFMQNNYMFDSLEKIPEKAGNYFVYAHINAPHGPYVYHPDGSFRFSPEEQDEKVLYQDAIIYINKRILEVVDTLQQESSQPPIIIIQGDHSIHHLTSGLDKHKILSAYYLPGDLSVPPYDVITPVNNFPLILKNYFDSSIELLPDTLWVKQLNDYEPIPAECGLQNLKER